MRERVHISILTVYTILFLIAGFFFIREYYQIREARKEMSLVSERIEAFDKIIYANDWREEYLKVMADGSVVKDKLVERFTYIPNKPEEFIADKFLHYWYFDLKSLNVDVAEELFSYDKILPPKTEPDAWKAELNVILFLTETYPPNRISHMNFSELFKGDLWMRFCHLSMEVNNVALIGYMQNSNLFLWEYNFEKIDEGNYQLEITFCVRMEELNP